MCLHQAPIPKDEFHRGSLSSESEGARTNFSFPIVNEEGYDKDRGFGRFSHLFFHPFSLLHHAAMLRADYLTGIAQNGDSIRAVVTPLLCVDLHCKYLPFETKRTVCNIGSGLFLGKPAPIKRRELWPMVLELAALTHKAYDCPKKELRGGRNAANG